MIIPESCAYYSQIILQTEGHLLFSSYILGIICQSLALTLSLVLRLLHAWAEIIKSLVTILYCLRNIMCWL